MPCNYLYLSETQYFKDVGFQQFIERLPLSAVAKYLITFKTPTSWIRYSENKKQPDFKGSISKKDRRLFFWKTSRLKYRQRFLPHHYSTTILLSKTTIRAELKKNLLLYSTRCCTIIAYFKFRLNFQWPFDAGLLGNLQAVSLGNTFHPCLLPPILANLPSQSFAIGLDYLCANKLQAYEYLNLRKLLTKCFTL